VIIWGKLFVQIFKMNMLEKINKSGVIKIIGKKLIVWDFSTYLTWSKIPSFPVLRQKFTF
ncbi:hypothetical protein, partial [Mesomycoplasma ovipneumoniae]|uniref:hypothetical protein n=1 Tax=Mesomycoplasma ovipneumoniae TaxID=29562 RepID=UPI0030804848